MKEGNNTGRNKRHEKRRREDKRRPHVVTVYAHDGVARSTGLRRKSEREGPEAERSLRGSKRRCYNDTEMTGRQTALNTRVGNLGSTVGILYPAEWKEIISPNCTQKQDKKPTLGALEPFCPGPSELTKDQLTSAEGHSSDSVLPPSMSMTLNSYPSQGAVTFFCSLSLEWMLPANTALNPKKWDILTTSRTLKLKINSYSAPVRATIWHLSARYCGG